MKPFDFYLPTKIIFGRKKIMELAVLDSALYQRILIVTDRGVLHKSGAMESIRRSLKGRIFQVFSDVEENPTYETLAAGKKMAREMNAQMVLGLGGGSPMDAAKGIAVMATNSMDMISYQTGTRLEADPLPIVCIPTTSGTGSEVTPFAVFSDPVNRNKSGFSHASIFPTVSIIDPELTYSMPKQVVVNTGLDALTHAIEAYLSTESTVLSDQLSIHAIDIILENLILASRRKHDRMDKLSYAAMIAGVAISMAGTILLHIMAYPLTVYHHVPHGRANAVLLPEFINFMEKYSRVPEKVKVLKERFDGVGGISGFVSQFGIPARLSQMGIKEDELETFVKKTMVKDDVRITPASISGSAILKIYKRSL